MFLGSAEQGKSALFYIASYIAKNKVALEQCLTVLNKAISHVNKYPSKYTPEQGKTVKHGTVKHILERTLNQLNLLMEISEYQAAAALLDLPTEISSDNFVFYHT